MTWGNREMAGGQVVAQLNREWASICDGSDEVAQWAVRHQALEGCRTLGDVLTAVGPDPDGVLGALIVESTDGSLTAARVVLQAMLGKVVLMAQVEGSAGLHDYLAAMWERIRTYPIARRPEHIAANLALDARKRARSIRRGEILANPWPPGAGLAALVDLQSSRERVDHNHEVGLLTVGDVLRAATELELIDNEAGLLLTSVYGRGMSSRQAASEHQLTPETVRYRCSRAVRTLADHSLELAETA